MTSTLRLVLIELPPATAADQGFPVEATAAIGIADLPNRLPLPDTVELVLAPLVFGDCDALEVIETLGTAGYRGRLRVLAPRLPNRQLVQRELRAHAVRQGITLDLSEQG